MKKMLALGVALIMGLVSLFSQNHSYVVKIHADGKGCWQQVADAKKQFRVENGRKAALKLEIGSKTLDVPAEGFESSFFPAAGEKIKLDAGNLEIPALRDGVAIKVEGGSFEFESCDPPPGTKVFIPVEAEEAAIKGQLSQNTRASNLEEVEHMEIVFDKERPVIMTSAGKTKLRKIHPHVDDYVVVRVTGYHPLRDSVAMKIEFDDRNDEDAGRFVAMMDSGSGQSGQGGTKTTEQSGIPKAEAHGGSATKAPTHEIIKTFRDEMANFYWEKYNEPFVSPEFLDACVVSIRAKIQTAFGIPNASPAAIREKANELLDAAPSTVDKKHFRAMLEEGLDYYNRITKFLDNPAWMFQVKNADLTKITPHWFRDGKPLDEPRSFDFFNKGGFKMDYSSGVILSGLVNHKFTTLPFTDSTGAAKGRIIRENDRDFNLGIGLLAHGYFRLPYCSRIKVSATTGFVANPSDNEFKLNYLFGGSLLLGHELRWVLTGGCILGKVSRLAEGLEAGKNDGTVLDPGTAVQTRNIYKSNWFIGVTYNFGSVSPGK